MKCKRRQRQLQEMDWASLLCSEGKIDSDAAISARAEGCTQQLTAEGSAS